MTAKAACEHSRFSLRTTFRLSRSRPASVSQPDSRSASCCRYCTEITDKRLRSRSIHEFKKLGESPESWLLPRHWRQHVLSASVDGIQYWSTVLPVHVFLRVCACARACVCVCVRVWVCVCV